MGRDNYRAKDKLAGVSIPEGQVSLDTAGTTGLLRPRDVGRSRV